MANKGQADMATFSDFYKQEQEILPLPGPSGKSNISGTQIAVVNAVELSLAGADMSNADVIKFASQVGALVTGEKFIKELSDKIGEPEKGESEDVFVERCKKTMFDLLGRHLG